MVSTSTVELTLEHLGGCLGQLDEYTIVDLKKAKKLEGLALLGINLVDTLDTDDKCKLRLSRDIEAIRLFRFARQPDLFSLFHC